MLTTMAVALTLGTGVALAAAISGTQGSDTLRGTPQDDQIYGLSGDDTLYGRDRSDELYGGAGEDRLFGSLGADEIYGGSGPDRLFGGPNRDFLNSADGRPNDFIDCGANDEATDTVVRDTGDELNHCGVDNKTPGP